MITHSTEIPRCCHPEQREPLGRWPGGEKQGSRAVCGEVPARDASHALSMTHPFR